MYQEEKTVIREILINSNRCADADFVIGAIEKAGGYQSIVDDEALWRDFGDMLDPLVGQRIIDVRNALRERGWADDGSRPMMGGPLEVKFGADESYRLTYKLKRTVTNAIACSFEVSGVPGFFMSDVWTRPAADLAEKIHLGVLSYRQQQSAKVSAAGNMSSRFVEAYARWQDNPDSPSFFDWAKEQSLLGDGDGQFLCFTNWSLRPDPEKSILDYALIDFEDGSLAIRRNHVRDSAWLVATPAAGEREREAESQPATERQSG